MSNATVKEGINKGQPGAGQPPPSGGQSGEATTAQVVKTFPKMLELYQDQVSLALPAHLRQNVGRYARLALSEFRQNEKLALCDPRSIFAAVILASQMGWELGGTLGHAYLVPYGKEAQLIPGWKGLVDLAHRSGRSPIWTGAIYEGEKFEFIHGARPDLKHVPSGEDDPAKLTHAYSVGWINGMQWPIIELWPKVKLQKHRDRCNKVGQKHYSFNNWEMYCRKIPLLQVVKYLPVSVEMTNALALDVAADSGQSQGLTISSAAEGAVFPSQWVDMKPEPAQAAEPEGGGQPTGQANQAPSSPPPQTAGKVETPPKSAPPATAPPAQAAPAPPPAQTQPAAPAPAPVATPAAPPPQAPPPAAPPATETAPIQEAQPPAWTEEKPAPAAAPAPAPPPVQEVAAPAAPTGERKRSKNPVIRKVKLPEFIDRTGPEDTPTEAQIAEARVETDRLDVNLEKTISDWTGVPLNEINTETLVLLTEVLRNYKPAGIVSYGGVSGGVRSALVEKITLTTLKMMPMVESVSVQNIATRIDANNKFLPDEHHLHGAESLLNELYKWAQALKTMRQ